MNTMITPYQAKAWRNLRLYQFPALANTRHAVFTRHGGVSPAPWQALNMSQAVGDTEARVTANFNAACAALNVTPTTTARSHLVHGNTIACISHLNQVKQYPQVDGMITQLPNINLMMSFADCTPLLLYDVQKQAVGLAHAGWRGTTLNMMGAMISAMQDHFDSQPADLTVVIGPAIGPCCYEVKADVISAVEGSLGQSQYNFEQRQNRTYLNLWAINEQQARAMGVQNVVVSELCTACRTHDFFSHRAEKGKTGRFAVFLGVSGHDDY